jgi:hypothetical protein
LKKKSTTMSTNSNVLARGIRIPRASLDAFLERHGLPPSTPKRMFEEEIEALDDLFIKLGVKGKIRLFEPYLESFEKADHVFLCYDWVYVLAEKEVDSSLRKTSPPAGYLEVAEQINKCGKVGTWVICYEEEWVLFQKTKFQDSVSPGIIP